MTRGTGLPLAWLDSVKALHAYLDRDGDGKLTRRRPRRTRQPLLAALVRLADGAGQRPSPADLDANPKDGKCLARRAGRRPPPRPRALPRPGRPARQPTETDALFDHLDRDKDGKLTARAGRRRRRSARLDLDDDELITPPSSSPSATRRPCSMDDVRPPRPFTRCPPVIELSADDSSFRPVRLPPEEYDQGTSRATALGPTKSSVRASSPSTPRPSPRPTPTPTARSTPRSFAASSRRLRPTWSSTVNLSADRAPPAPRRSTLARPLEAAAQVRPDSSESGPSGTVVVDVNDLSSTSTAAETCPPSRRS